MQLKVPKYHSVKERQAVANITEKEDQKGATERRCCSEGKKGSRTGARSRGSKVERAKGVKMSLTRNGLRPFCVPAWPSPLSAPSFHRAISNPPTITAASSLSTYQKFATANPTLYSYNVRTAEFSAGDYIILHLGFPRSCHYMQCSLAHFKHFIVMEDIPKLITVTPIQTQKDEPS